LNYLTVSNILDTEEAFMKLKLFVDSKLDDDYIDIKYRNMNMQISQIIEIAGSKQPSMMGRKEGYEFAINIQDVLYYETVDKKYFIYTDRETYETHIPLKEVEESLKQYGFSRINKSMIVNIFKVSKLKADSNMKILAYLANEEVVTVTRHYRTNFYQMIEQISFEKKRGRSYESGE